MLGVRGQGSGIRDCGVRAGEGRKGKKRRGSGTVGWGQEECRNGEKGRKI